MLNEGTLDDFYQHIHDDIALFVNPTTPPEEKEEIAKAFDYHLLIGTDIIHNMTKAELDDILNGQFATIKTKKEIKEIIKDLESLIATANADALLDEIEGNFADIAKDVQVDCVKFLDSIEVNADFMM